MSPPDPSTTINGKEQILIKDNADQSKRKIIFLSKDAQIDGSTAEGGIVQPPTVQTLQVYNANGSGESVCSRAAERPKLGCDRHATASSATNTRTSRLCGRSVQGGCGETPGSSSRSYVTQKCSRSRSRSTSRRKAPSQCASRAAPPPTARGSAAS